MTDRLSECRHSETWFDRQVCPEPCGTMHTRCVQCGVALDRCAYDESRSLSPESLAETVEVPLDALCVIYEAAERFGLYGGTLLHGAAMALPMRVHARLVERSAERTKALLAERVRQLAEDTAIGADHDYP